MNYVANVLINESAIEDVRLDPLFVPTSLYVDMKPEHGEVGAHISHSGVVLRRYFLVTVH